MSRLTQAPHDARKLERLKGMVLIADAAVTKVTIDEQGILKLRHFLSADSVQSAHCLVDSLLPAYWQGESLFLRQAPTSASPTHPADHQLMVKVNIEFR